MSETGAITGYIDVAQVVLYAFWVFFFGLVWYIRREDKREGYPLESDIPGEEHLRSEGFPFMPRPKQFLLPGGGIIQRPHDNRDTRKHKLARVAPWPGSPFTPTGDPMKAGVGPGSWAERADEPTLTDHGEPMIVPMRSDPDYEIESRDPDPRGFDVVGADGEVGGVVVDLWVDRSEMVARYYELELPGRSSKKVLLPINFTRIDRWNGQVKVKAILGAQFKDVPATRRAQQVTLLEEDRIVAYYGAGTLYAEPDRLEPLL